MRCTLASRCIQENIKKYIFEFNSLDANSHVSSSILCGLADAFKKKRILTCRRRVFSVARLGYVEHQARV